MIVCPSCTRPLEKQDRNYLCKHCNLAYPEQSGVTRFQNDQISASYDYDAYLDEINKIRKSEKTHFWFINRRNIILSLFRRYVADGDQCIEIGAGTGSIAQMLTENGYKVAVGEMHDLGVDEARNAGIKDVYQFDIMKNPFVDEFDVVGMFDVLEHMENDEKALSCVTGMLRTGGKIILSLPAHMWLWCKDDEVSRHYRRYENKNIVALLEKTGCQVLYASNHFVSLVPLLFLRSRLNIYSDEITVNNVVNTVLGSVLKVEEWIIKTFRLRPVIGGSIFVVAEKRKQI